MLLRTHAKMRIGGAVHDAKATAVNVPSARRPSLHHTPSQQPAFGASCGCCFSACACSSSGHASPRIMCRAASGKLWTPGGSGGGSGSKGGPPEREPGPGPREQTAMRLRAICDALPELPEESLVAMIQSNPGLLNGSPSEMRSKLEGVAAAAGCDLPAAAKFLTKLPAAWNRSPEALKQKLDGLAAELRCDVAGALQLLTAQPSLFNVNVPGLVRDKIEVLASTLGVSAAKASQMVGRQPILWHVQKGEVKSDVGAIAGALGLDSAAAADLVSRMPVLLALEPAQYGLSLQAVSATLGVPIGDVAELLVRNLGLLALPSAALASAIESLAAGLEVAPEQALALLTTQPTLLCTQIANIKAAVEVIGDSLAVDRPRALALLAKQPALLYDFNRQTIAQRLDGLAATFGSDVEEVRALAVKQPALLVVAPATIKAGVATFTERFGKKLAEVLEFMVDDPGMFVGLGYASNVVESWASRLGLRPEAVAMLVSAQPALLEITPVTVKARLEGLSALFGVPLELVTQLVMRHPALLIVPPNASITRVKNLSTQIGSSMQQAGALVAKAPVVLAFAGPDVKPVTSAMLDIAATYEYQTVEWLQRRAKDGAPVRPQSFATIDRRP